MAVLPDFRAASFEPGAPIDNPFFPLPPGTIRTFRARTEDFETGEVETEQSDVFVTFATKTIAGVQAVVVRDTEYVDGVIVEDTVDWYAQDTDGNVWYLGEKTFAFEYDDEGAFVETSTEGSWRAGVDGARPGHIMPAEPGFGAAYYQEFAPGIAEDEAIVAAVNQEVETGLGAFAGVLKTLDTTALEPDVAEFKYYAPGVGPILVEEGLGPDGPELVAELEAVRQVGDGAPDGFELPDFGPFAGEGGEVFVTYLGGETEADNAIGAYSIDLATGRLLQGRILFASTEDAEPGESVAVRVKEGQALGLFIVPDVDTLGLDLSAFEDGGLRFSNMLGGRATIGDGLAPLLKGDGQVLPIQALHALGTDGGVNFLNPAAGQHAVFDPVDMVLGFEDRRVTDEAYDGDFDDVLVGLDGLALPELQAATDAPLV